MQPELSIEQEKPAYNIKPRPKVPCAEGKDISNPHYNVTICIVVLTAD